MTVRQLVMLGLTGLAVVAVTVVYALQSGRHIQDNPNRPVELSWKILSLMDAESGQVPPIIDRLQTVTVKTAGFMVPLEDQLENVSEFLLVPYEGACIHTPPPPPNQMIHVKMKNALAKYTWQAIEVIGRFSLLKTQSPYGQLSYEIEGDKVELWKGPEKDRSRLGMDL